MAHRLIWAPVARQDLRDLVAYIGENDPQAAGEFARAVFRAIERLAQFPRSGRQVPEFADPMIREVIRRPCRIVYRVQSGAEIVEIARVWHAARGTPEL